MERRPPSTTRSRIPGGYGNYPGRDPESPPPPESSGSGGTGGGGRKKRTPAPWGGLFKGKEDVALPTAPWSSGSPQDGRYEEPTTPQGQYQQWQNQQYARTSAAGTAASGAYSSIASTGGGYGSPPPSLSGYGSSSPPPPPPPARRRASPLVANAPRLTVIPAPTKPAAVHSGTAAPTELQQQQQQRRSSPKGRGAGLSKWGSWGISRGGGEANSSGKEATAGGISSRKLLSEPIAERTGLLSSAARPEPTSFGSVRAGGAGSFLSGTLSREQSASASRFAEGGAGGPRRGRGSLPKSGEGFAAAGKPSPFLAARSSLTSSGKKGVTRRSPLEQSAVNPFSASFSDSSIRGNEDHDQPSWLAGYGGGGGANHGGVRAGAGQPLLRRAGASGGYGSGWGGDGGGGGGGGGGWREASSERPKPSGKGRKVDDQGHQIFFKHGVRLVEAAEIQLESQGRPATYLVFILPYLFLALALWLDMGPLDKTLRIYTPSGNYCDDAGVCSWAVTDAPMHNSFLTLKGDFKLVDGLQPAETPDAIGASSSSGGSGGGAEAEPTGDEAAAAVAGQEGGGGGPLTRGRSLYDSVVEEGEVEPRRVPGSRSLFLPFGKPAEGEGAEDDDDDRVQLVVGVAMEVRGLVEQTQEWEALYSCTARDNVQILTCRTTDKVCETSALGRVVFDSMGTGGHHSEYAVDATLKVIEDGKPVPGGGGLLAKSGTFEVLTESEVYAKVRSIARLPLLALTAFLLLYWMTRGFGGAGGERDPAPSAIVPERRYITMMLFGLLLWQNPVLAVEDWLVLTPVGFSFEDSAVWHWVRLARDLCQFTGMQVMWLCWICLMDGQQLVRKRPQRTDSSVYDGTSPAAEAAYRQVAGEDEDALSVATTGDESIASPGFLKDDYPPHHPRSDSFIDFFLPKVLYAFFSLAVGVAVALLRHPYLARLDRIDWLKGRFELSYEVMSMVSGLFWLGWTLYFVKVALNSGRVLRGQPFFGTRRQQLSYRVMLVQGFLVAVLFAATVGVDAFYVVGHLLRQQAVPRASTGFTVESMTSGAAALSAWTGGVRQPLGLLFLISAVCFNLAYLFLPPTHSVKRLFDRMYINMERDMPPREVVRRYKDSQELSPLFCVETSCFLVEVAWQAYYDPHKVDLSDFVAPGKQDLSYLGLELVAYFNDEEHEIRAILCRGEDRLILAFRGTARVENLLTDLKFHQVPLPQLLPPGRSPIDIQLPDGHRTSRSYSNASNSSNRRGGADGGLGSHSHSHRRPSLFSSREGKRYGYRSDASESRSPAPSPAVAGGAAAAPRGVKKGGVGVGVSPTGRRAASVAALSSPRSSVAPVSPPRSPVAALPRGVVDEPRGPGGGGEEEGAGEPPVPDVVGADGENATAAAGVGGTDSVANGAEGAEDNERADGGEATSDALVQEVAEPDIPVAAADSVAPADNGEGDDGDGASPPTPSAAQPRPKNPNDLVRLFMAESSSGGFGSGGAAAGSTSSASGGDGVASKDGAGTPGTAPGDASPAVPAATGAEREAVDDSGDGRVDLNNTDGGDGPHGDLLAGLEDEGGSEEKAPEEEETEEGEGEEDNHWGHASTLHGGVGGADSSYGRSLYNDSCASEVDVEASAADGSFGEGKFYIDPQGDGSFTTATARCFKAVIHRIPVARQALPRVHGGFWEAYSKLREKVLAALAVELQDDYRPLYVTGHSLGGALASLAAYDIDKNFTLPDPMTLYTFGSPRVGNGVFARKLNSKVKHHFRIVNDGDLITALPRFFGTYKHAGCKVVVDSERYGNFIVAPTLVEQTFGAKPLTSLTPHLLNQYRECLEACMEEADLEDYFSRGIGVDPTLVPEWLKGKRRRQKEVV